MPFSLLGQKPPKDRLNITWSADDKNRVTLHAPAAMFAASFYLAAEARKPATSGLLAKLDKEERIGIPEFDDAIHIGTHHPGVLSALKSDAGLRALLLELARESTFHLSFGPKGVRLVVPHRRIRPKGEDNDGAVQRLEALRDRLNDMLPRLEAAFGTLMPDSRDESIRRTNIALTAAGLVLGTCLYIWSRHNPDGHSLTTDGLIGWAIVLGIGFIAAVSAFCWFVGRKTHFALTYLGAGVAASAVTALTCALPMTVGLNASLVTGLQNTEVEVAGPPQYKSVRKGPSMYHLPLAQPAALSGVTTSRIALLDDDLPLLRQLRAGDKVVVEHGKGLLGVPAVKSVQPASRFTAP